MPLVRNWPIVILLLASLSAPGCSQGDASAEQSSAKPAAEASPGGTDELPEFPIGASCTVQFRRDVLGGNTSLPVPPTTGSINGADVSISGKLIGVDENWIVLKSGDQQEWVPRDMVLLVSVVRPKSRPHGH